MYGSSLTCVTRSPRASSKAPIDALASPLPMEETTPPVTNTYLVGLRLMDRALPAGKHSADMPELPQGPRPCEAETAARIVLLLKLAPENTDTAGWSWRDRR